MVKRLCALLLALLLTLAAGSTIAELKLWEDMPAQKALKTYIANVNEFLAENGELAQSEHPKFEQASGQATSFRRLSAPASKRCFLPVPHHYLRLIKCAYSDYKPQPKG